MAARRFRPALLIRSRAPIQSSRSGFIRVLHKHRNIHTLQCIGQFPAWQTGWQWCVQPIQRISIPAFRHSYTCFEVATSVETYIPVSFFTSFSHARPSTPTHSKPPVWYAVSRFRHGISSFPFRPVAWRCTLLVLLFRRARTCNYHRTFVLNTRQQNRF